MNRGWTYEDRVPRAAAGEPVAVYYASRYRHSGAGEWAARAGRGEILLNGRAAAAGERLREGDVLLWRRPPWEEPETPRDARIVYEDAAIIAVDKPPGLPVLPDGGFLEHTLVRIVAGRYPGERPAPAHRLGRGTSGLVLFARTAAARRDLAAQFRAASAGAPGGVRRTYVARSVPDPRRKPGDELEISTPVGPVPHPLLGQVFAASAGGRHALSRCRVLEASPDSLLWRVELVTGRPHQIRIHLASAGYPLLGDPFFLAGGLPRPDALPGDCGYFLRACAVCLAHPVTGAHLRIEVPVARPGAEAPQP